MWTKFGSASANCTRVHMKRCSGVWFISPLVRFTIEEKKPRSAFKVYVLSFHVLPRNHSKQWPLHCQLSYTVAAHNTRCNMLTRRKLWLDVLRAQQSMWCTLFDSPKLLLWVLAILAVVRQLRWYVMSPGRATFGWVRSELARTTREMTFPCLFR